MSWWRRDPSLSPIHRHAQRLLRFHEAVFPTRCYSRTPALAAKHQDDDGGSKRPEGISNLEWMQLQHYKQWRKRLSDDPYQAMFGASNDMLSGRGLKDWEWISKSFPRWMLRELEGNKDEGLDDKGRPDKDKIITDHTHKSFLHRTPQKRATQEPPRGSENDNSPPAHDQYPKKVEISNEEDMESKRYESHFPQPSHMSTRFERDSATGVSSPSDFRRPQDGTHVKVMGKPSNGLTAEMPYAPSSMPRSAATNFTSPAPTPSQSTTIHNATLSSDSPIKANAKLEREEASARESSFIEEFLAAEAQSYKPNDHISNKSWRQTALQRRAISEVVAQPESQPAAITQATDVASDVHASLMTDATPLELRDQGTSLMKETHAMLIKSKLPPPQADKTVVGIQHEDKVKENLDMFKGAAPTERGNVNSEPRSISNILSQLPKDDLDFLSATEIRASMGTRKSNKLPNEKKLSDRQKLEQTFDRTTDEWDDPLTSAQIINDQLVRRIARRDALGFQKEVQEENVRQRELQFELPFESTFDRLKRTIGRGSAMLASHFWQEPEEEKSLKMALSFFNRLNARIRQGRMAMRPTVEDLEKIVPQSKPLLKRLKEHEDNFDVAVRRLRCRLHDGDEQSIGADPRVMKRLRERYRLTDHELDCAYKDLRLAQDQGQSKQLLPSQQRRLNNASKVAYKTAELTSHMIISLQTHLENPGVDRIVLAGYHTVANSLLTLHHTQKALMTLIDRVMFMYGLAPELKQKSPYIELLGDRELPRGEEATAPVQEPSNTITEKSLAYEVQAQKLATRGLSDDEYAQALKSAAKKSFDERSPLAHSLFRPFAPIIERLFTSKETVAEGATTEALEAAMKKQSDAKLVADVREAREECEAYEDTYGPITVQHRQVADATEEGVQQKMFTLKPIGTQMHDTPKANLTSIDDLTFEGTSTLSKVDSPMPVSTPGDNLATADKASSTVGGDFSPAEADKSSELMFQLKPVSGGAFEATSTSISNPTIAIGAETDNLIPLSGGAPECSSNPTKKGFEQSDSIISSTPVAERPTNYTILIHDPETSKLSITHSKTGPPRDTSPVLPLHQALATLDAPSKFVPHITNGLEIVSAKKDMLVLRDALDSTTSTPSFKTITPFSSPYESSPTSEDQVDPIDGTARLSPTGYVGPHESVEHFLIRTNKNNKGPHIGIRTDAYYGSLIKELEHEKRQRAKDAKRGRVATVVRTAIWAAAVCYIVGVMGDSRMIRYE